jgi:hypothetical protein
MTSTKYIGMEVHKESISIAVMKAAGKMVMECVIALIVWKRGACFEAQHLKPQTA